MMITSQGNGFNSLNMTVSASEDKTKIQRNIENESVEKLTVKTEIASDKLKKEEKSLRGKKEALENQVAESQDGDTLQLSKSSISKLENKKKEVLVEKEKMVEDGEKTVLTEDLKEVKEEKAKRIREEIKEAELLRELRVEGTRTELAKAEKREEILKDSIKKEASKLQSKDISFAGKTDNDIAKMFLRGDISKTEYDSVIEERESKREAMESKEFEFTRNLLNRHAETKEFQRFEKEIKLAFSKEDSGKISAGDRLLVIEAAAGKIASKKEKDVKMVVS